MNSALRVYWKIFPSGSGGLTNTRLAEVDWVALPLMVNLASAGKVTRMTAGAGSIGAAASCLAARTRPVTLRRMDNSRDRMGFFLSPDMLLLLFDHFHRPIPIDAACYSRAWPSFRE